MIEEEKNEKREKNEKAEMNWKQGSNKGAMALLHIVQHGCFVLAVVTAMILILGSIVVVQGRKGTEIYRLDISTDQQYTQFEDSELFHNLLRKDITDVICFGAIKAQLETDGKFDPEKQIDVTAFANRYKGVPAEYITAPYFLEDLIKWGQSGFEYEDVYMTSDEVDAFLQRTRTVTKVDLKDGRTMSYLNSDLKGLTTVVDVSGNIMSDEEHPVRNSANANILVNRYYTAEGKNIEDYVFSWDEYYELCENVQRAAEDLSINYEEYLTYKDYYDEENTNVVYYLLRTIGKDTEVFSNQPVKSAKFEDLQKQLKEECDRYVIYDPMNMSYETNTKVEEAEVRYVLNGYEYAYPENTQILIGIKGTYDAEDAFAQAKSGYNGFSNFWQYLMISAAAALLYLCLLFLLTMKEGRVRNRRTGETAIMLKAADRIPTEIMLLLTAAVILVIAFVAEIITESLDIRAVLSNSMMPVIAGALALVVSLLFSFFYYSMVRRIKAHTLWKNSIIRRLCHLAVRTGRYVYDHGSLTARVLVPALALFFLNMLLWIIWDIDGALFAVFLVLTVLADLAAVVLLYQSAIGRQRILNGIKQINAGDMEHKINETSLYGDNLILAREVNGIGDGIRNAVATSMKDERLKADLITNVSHDIKTPLTSIINYVDLIKRENIDNPKIQEYIDVLDQKSQRLKQLTDDLVEASKISSGNIVLQWEKINLVELLNQTIGEFSEKFEQRQLTPVMRAEKGSVVIKADSRRIWRVIENLFNNIIKYALQGTRVYIDIEELQAQKDTAQVALSIRNISANPIKVNTDELTERFIRGDESRTTEGSGLGLSIAKNLTEVMGGKFEIFVDGDLFKVVLTFPLLE